MSENPLVVYKYRLRPYARRMEMPKSARLLHVGAQGSEAYIWALVDPEAGAVDRLVAVVPTGMKFSHPQPLEHVGTFTIRAPVEAQPGERVHVELIFHVFDAGEDINQ